MAMTQAQRSKRHRQKRTKLEIQGIVSAALKISDTVKQELPSHEGLSGAAERVASMAYEAERISNKMRKPWSLHRLPAIFSMQQ